MTTVLRWSFAGLITALLGAAAHADTIDMSGLPHERCARCHGLDGNSAMPRFPRLAGQSPAYVKKQLADFRGGRRTNDEGGMSGIADTLSEGDINAVALYFAAQVPRAMGGGAGGDMADVTIGRRIYFKGRPGVAACVDCHGAALLRAAGAPLIAGQHADYLRKQLLDFKRGARRNDADGVMRRIAATLSSHEIRALAAAVSGTAAPTADR